MKRLLFFLTITLLLYPFMVYADTIYQKTVGWTGVTPSERYNVYKVIVNTSEVDIEDAGAETRHTTNFEMGYYYAVSVTNVIGAKESDHSNIVFLEKKFPLGDCNHDGSINSADISFALLNRGVPVTSSNIGCDVWPLIAPDGKIDNYDVLQVKKYVAAAL